jgi:hypothetical protein
VYGGTRDENNGFKIGWLDLLAPRLQVLLITLNYNGIAQLHNLAFTVAHALGFSVSTSRLLATDLNTETSTSNQYEVFLSFLVQSPWNLGTQLKLRLLPTPPAYCSLLQLTTHSSNLLLTPPAYCSLLQLTAHSSSLLLIPPAYCSLLQLTAHSSSLLPTPPAYCSLLQLTAHSSSLLLTPPAYCSLLQLTTARKRHLLSPINFRRGPIENTSRGRYPLFCDVIAYAEVRLPSRCLETGCITQLFSCCDHALFSNGCSCGSTVLARSKYATIFWCYY